jgi:hypothetical protein
MQLQTSIGCQVLGASLYPCTQSRLNFPIAGTGTHRSLKCHCCGGRVSSSLKIAMTLIRQDSRTQKRKHKTQLDPLIGRKSNVTVGDLAELNDLRVII